MFLVRLDIYGFWIGLIAAETVTNTFLFILVQRFDWKRHADAALKRISFGPKNVETSISSVTNMDKKSQATAADREPDNWVKLVRIKLLVFVLLICFLITGIITSTVIPL